MSLIGARNEKLDARRRNAASKVETETKSKSNKTRQGSKQKVDETVDPVSYSPEITDATTLHALAKDAMRDKIYGCLIGSAVGDCLGLYTEFMDKRTARKHYPERTFRLTDPVTPLLLDGHRARFGPNVWTDDTDQALSILLGYLHNGIHDAKEFATRLHIWVDQGLRALKTQPLGLGETVAKAVLNPLFLEDPVKSSYEAWKASSYFGAANGSLMRCHPLGVICVFKPLSEAFDIATEYGLITHPNTKCIVSCCIVVGLIRGFLLAEISEESQIDAMITKAVRWTDQWDDKRRRKISEVDKKDARLAAEPRLDHVELMRHVHGEIENLEELDLDESGKIGYVYKSLGATIFLVRSAMRQLADLDYSEAMNLKQSGELFEQLITDLVMEAGDADTNACPAGAVLGAYLGYQGVPQYWRDGLKYGGFLKHKSEGLCQTLRISEGDYGGKEDVQTSRDGGNGFVRGYEERYYPAPPKPSPLKKPIQKGTKTPAPVASGRVKRPTRTPQTGPSQRVKETKAVATPARASEAQPSLKKEVVKGTATARRVSPVAWEGRIAMAAQMRAERARRETTPDTVLNAEQRTSPRKRAKETTQAPPTAATRKSLEPQTSPKKPTKATAPTSAVGILGSMQISPRKKAVKE